VTDTILFYPSLIFNLYILSCGCECSIVESLLQALVFFTSPFAISEFCAGISMYVHGSPRCFGLSVEKIGFGARETPRYFKCSDRGDPCLSLYNAVQDQSHVALPHTNLSLSDVISISSEI
jgi:hypothetical protein